MTPISNRRFLCNERSRLQPGTPLYPVLPSKGNSPVSRGDSSASDPAPMLATLEECQWPEILFFDLWHVRGGRNLTGTPVTFGFLVARFYPTNDLVFSYRLSFYLFVHVLCNHFQEFFRVDRLDDVGICLLIHGFDGVIQSRISCEDDFPRSRKHPVDLRE